MCDQCQAKDIPTTLMILNGKFGAYCFNCKNNQRRIASAQSAEWHRERDREDHKRDMLQPWINGKINVEFARQYPGRAKEIYSEEELKEV